VRRKEINVEIKGGKINKEIRKKNVNRLDWIG
jgi:hypothetical protein